VTALRELVALTVRQWVASHDLVVEEPSDFTFVVVLPGEHKLRTAVSLVVGEHALSVDAFVMRHPEDNVDSVHRWLLERNTKLTLVSYAVDHLGDVYLSGRIPLAAVTDDLLDAVMGQVLDASDGPFNLLLEMGFESAIRREWAWRLDRGEPTGNLAAFGHLRPTEAPTE
jgi:hypothetical protein